MIPKIGMLFVVVFCTGGTNREYESYTYTYIMYKIWCMMYVLSNGFVTSVSLLLNNIYIL